MNNSKNNRYVFVWGNYQGLWTLENNLSATALIRQYEWSRMNNIIQIAQDNNMKAFYSAKDLRNDRRRGKKFLDQNYAENFLVLVEENYQKTWKLMRNLKNTNYRLLTNQELLTLFKEIKADWMRQIDTFRALQADGTSALVKEITKHFSQADLSVVMSLPQKDLVAQEMEEWQKLLRKKNVDKKALLAHSDKFPWIVAAHFRLENVLTSLRNRIKNNEDKKTPNDLDEKIKNNQQKILSQVPEKMKSYVRLFHQLSLDRMRIKSCWAGLDYYLIPLMQEIAKRSGETIIDINKYYITSDLENLLLRKKRLSSKEKDRRRFFFVGLWKDNKLVFKSGLAALRLAKLELGDLLAEKKVAELKGTVANKGNASGVARILWANNIENTKKLRAEFKKGQILVTQMTQPNIMDIARRAGAIVTDEGGLLSHAAIISREFGIPCIVGTHQATSVIKDGDLVEVNANKGVVKILRK